MTMLSMLAAGKPSNLAGNDRPAMAADGLVTPKQPRRRAPYDAHSVGQRLEQLFEWLAEQHGGWGRESALYRALMAPGRGSLGGHRILAHRPPPRLADIHDAYILQMPIMQRALALRYAWQRAEDGAPVTNRMRAERLGISLRAWDRLICESRRQIVYTMHNPPRRVT